MRLALASAVVALALFTGSARGDTFAIVPASDPSSSSAILFSGTTTLPSAQAPNFPGALVLPLNWTQQAGQETPITFAQLRGLWQSAGSAYSIPWPVLAAINKIESNFGRNMGPSSAGAVGWMQFMPDTWLRWGADYNGDAVADPWNPRDAIFSAARYLAAAGGATDISSAILSYNHAQWYVNEVLSLARLLSSDSSLSFSLDGMQADLEKAAKQVASVNEQIAKIRAEAHSIRARANRMFAEAESAPLIEERSAKRMQAAAVEAGAVSLEKQLPALESELEQAQKALAQARANAQTSSFDPGSAVYLASPQYLNGYVFPVGGGPSRVSVGHTHHDYPAADIAAPAGSPVYALADGVVVRAWSTIDPLCGIGMDFRTDDGQTWAYCHLSYIEPTLAAGVRLTAGAPVGLVGSTGHSTGPHLHLGLVPSGGYPQDEAWFQSFAGFAFRWQDEPTTVQAIDTVAPSSPVVFAVVTDSSSSAGSNTDSASSPTQAATPAPPRSFKSVVANSSPFSAPPSG
jgi:murein DD-endopeptidase MepM/ murein hydrolase activator NlpD